MIMMMMINLLIAHAQVAVSSTFAASVGQTAGAQMAQPGMVFWIALVLGVPLAFWFIDVLIDMLAGAQWSGRHRETPAERAIALHERFKKVEKETGIHTDAK